MSHFGRVLGFGGMLAILVALTSADVVAQKKKDKNKDKDYPAATDADYKSIQKQKELYGTIVTIDAAMITVRVEYWHNEPNPKYKPPKDNPAVNQWWKTYNDLQVQMLKAANARTPKEAAQAQQRIAQDMNRLQQQYTQMMAKGMKIDPNNSPFISVSNTKDFDLEVQEKVVYRKMVLPFEYDNETGKPKVYTDKEKADLRGDDKTKPGYISKLEEITAGAEIKLRLTPPKKKEKDKDAEKAKDDKDKEDKVPEEVLRPTINMVVMTKEAPEATSSADDKKKKKKDKN